MITTRVCTPIFVCLVLLGVRCSVRGKSCLLHHLLLEVTMLYQKSVNNISQFSYDEAGSDEKGDLIGD